MTDVDLEDPALFRKDYLGCMQQEAEVDHESVQSMADCFISRNHAVKLELASRGPASNGRAECSDDNFTREAFAFPEYRQMVVATAGALLNLEASVVRRNCVEDTLLFSASDPVFRLRYPLWAL